MAHPMLKLLDQHWRGPALEVDLPDHETFHLGIGEGRTRVIVHDPRVLSQMRFNPSMAFGEAYMDRRLEVDGKLMDLLQGFNRTAARLPKTLAGRVLDGLRRLPAVVNPAKAKANAQHHYDIGNDFYRLWLDPSLTYSCAYFLNPHDDLATVQQQKVDVVCRKARIQPGQRVLDIGCGWGSVLFHAAETFDAEAVGVTPAKEQANWIEGEAERRGLRDRVKVIRRDWRELQDHGPFDRIVSVGMFEHVGAAQYPAFFRGWRDLLAEDGLSVLHTIGRMTPVPGGADPWIAKYIFPGGWLPTLSELGEHAGQTGMRVADVENLWQHYAETLRCWRENFDLVRDEVEAMFDDRFARMWWLYLTGSEAGFRWGGLQLWQVVMGRQGATPWPLNRAEVAPPHAMALA